MCEALRELFADDLRESELKGRNAEKIELIVKKFKKGCTAEETADMLEESPDLMKQIYDVIGQYAPDFDVEKIYKTLIDRRVLFVH